MFSKRRFCGENVIIGNFGLMKGDVKPSMMSEEEYDEPERPDSTTSPIVVAF